MAERTWEVSKTCFCEHVNQQVALEAEKLYPVDFLPDPPRLLAHRCSLGRQCNQFTQPTCVWAGTNPDHDPFRR
jgi:hypothetical protein